MFWNNKAYFVGQVSGVTNYSSTGTTKGTVSPVFITRVLVLLRHRQIMQQITQLARRATPTTTIMMIEFVLNVQEHSTQ